jgi:hypothetical protein
MGGCSDTRKTPGSSEPAGFVLSLVMACCYALVAEGFEIMAKSIAAQWIRNLYISVATTYCTTDSNSPGCHGFPSGAYIAYTPRGGYRDRQIK